MKNVILSAAIVAAIGLPSIVIAQTTTRTTIHIPSPQTLICHPLGAGETGNATMGTTPLHCRPVNMARITAAVRQIRTAMRPQATSVQAPVENALTSITTELQMPAIPGSNGNPNN